MTIDLVVFDMAGTTVSEGGAVYRCLRDTLGAHGHEVTGAALKGVRGLDKREALRVLLHGSPAASFDRIHDEFVARMISFYRTAPEVTEMPGTSQVFRQLHAHGIKAALNTGFSRDIAQVLIERFGWERDGLIDASVASDEVERGRPHPFMIHWLMQRLGIEDPARVAKVGDAPADLLEGRRAGCGLVVGVTQGSSLTNELASIPHDHLIGSVAELPALLGLETRA